jgi:hypothetical protein
MTQATRWWYLSFADEEFRGAVFVRATGMLDAVREAHALRANPGGEVIGIEIEDETTARLPALEFRERLLTKADLFRLWPDEMVHLDGTPARKEEP